MTVRNRARLQSVVALVQWISGSLLCHAIYFPKVFRGSGRWPVLEVFFWILWKQFSRLNIFHCRYWSAVIQGVCKCLPAVLQGDDHPGCPIHVGRSDTHIKEGKEGNEAHWAPWIACWYCLLTGNFLLNGCQHEGELAFPRSRSLSHQPEGAPLHASCSVHLAASMPSSDCILKALCYLWLLELSIYQSDCRYTI